MVVKEHSGHWCATQVPLNERLASAEGSVIGREPSSVSTFRIASLWKEPRQLIFNDCWCRNIKECPSWSSWWQLRTLTIQDELQFFLWSWPGLLLSHMVAWTFPLSTPAFFSSPPQWGCHGHSLINVLYAKLHLRVCFPGNLACGKEGRYIYLKPRVRNCRRQNIPIYWKQNGRKNGGMPHMHIFFIVSSACFQWLSVRSLDHPPHPFHCVTIHLGLDNQILKRAQVWSFWRRENIGRKLGLPRYKVLGCPRGRSSTIASYG